jgi:hypothetical protein
MSVSKPQLEGYLAAAIGGFSGTVLMVILIMMLSRAFITFFPQVVINRSLIILMIIVGIGLGEVGGCFAALRLWHHANAKATALWLLTLIIPGFILFYLVSLFIGSLLAASLIAIALPLIARFLTQRPNYPGTVQRVLHTYAQRPPSF